MMSYTLKKLRMHRRRLGWNKKKQKQEHFSKKEQNVQKEQMLCLVSNKRKGFAVFKYE